MDSSYTAPRTKTLYRGAQIVWYILGVFETVLAFRFLLKLFGANAASGFAGFIYDLSYPFVAPFLNVFRISRVEGSVFEWTTLLAMLVYWIVARGIISLFIIGKPVSTPEAAIKLEEQE